MQHTMQTYFKQKCIANLSFIPNFAIEPLITKMDAEFHILDEERTYLVGERTNLENEVQELKDIAKSALSDKNGLLEIFNIERLESNAKSITINNLQNVNYMLQKKINKMEHDEYLVIISILMDNKYIK